MEDIVKLTKDSLMKKRGEKYDEAEFTKFFESFGYSDIQVTKSGEQKKFSMKLKTTIGDTEKEVTKVCFLRLDQKGIYYSFIWVDGDVNKAPGSGADMGCGIAALIIIVAIIGTIGYFVISAILNATEDDDCNDSYIEQDYNGDGEEDAEDFRIQTEACN